MSQSCLRCGTPLPEGGGACPQCGINLDKIRKIVSEFFPSGGLHLKIQDALDAVGRGEISQEELHRRLQAEWQIVDNLRLKYANVQSQALAPMAEVMTTGLAIYQEALVALGDEGDTARSFELAAQADEYLSQMDAMSRKIELSHQQRTEG